LKEKIAFLEAYYQVKLELREDDRWNHPFYWAAFTLYN
jgi:CHAT domain-containing protein